ncbi:DUF222 domain-containing protein [Motilibacter deserti]|uniref:DUF222 domain-containing protein n=1 Tax=Motilibacter deserti TaxID=2714956 RepID=A0ABX0GZH0_9ACTN|nr:DUF222 domain-containing protein [Motilibacter deserti]NHC14598.1 DUF222 domain-containing protein [Motilibacter deserti]
MTSETGDGRRPSTFVRASRVGLVVELSGGHTHRPSAPSAGAFDAAVVARLALALSPAERGVAQMIETQLMTLSEPGTDPAPAELPGEELAGEGLEGKEAGSDELEHKELEGDEFAGNELAGNEPSAAELGLTGFIGAGASDAQLGSDLAARARREALTALEATLDAENVQSEEPLSEEPLSEEPLSEEPLSVAAVLTKLAPGCELIAHLCQLQGLALSADDRLEVVRSWERVAAWLTAQQARALAAAGAAIAVEQAPEPHSAAAEHWSGEQAAEAEIGSALRWSLPTVATRLKQATELTGRCAPTLDELEAGRIEPRQASAVVEACAPLDDDAALAVQQRVLPRAAEQTVAQTRRALRRAVLAVDSASAAERHERARADRGIDHHAEPDGMAALAVRTNAAGVATIWAALDAVAAAMPATDKETGEPVPISARRVDGLVALCAAVLADPGVLAGLPRAATPAAAVRVTVSAETLLGLSDSPGELDGHGPIPAEMARELAADGAWRRWLVEPRTGELLDIGSETYRPGARLAAFIAARDRTCRGPGSGYPARLADLDHVVPFDGSNTTRANLQPLRRRWHNAKTHGGWQSSRAPDGSTTWTSPLGRQYVIPPERLDPDPP